MSNVPQSKRAWIIEQVIEFCAFLCGVAVLLIHLGFQIYDCRGPCAASQQTWYASLFLIFLLTTPALVFYSSFKGKEPLTRALIATQAAAGVIAFCILLVNRVFCPLCVTAQCLFFAAFFHSLTRRPAQIASYAFCCLALLVVGKSWSPLPLPTPATFQARVYEPRLKGSPAAFVIFSDPLCPSCRLSEEKFENSAGIGLPVLHRWKLLGSHGEAAVKLASLIESANRRNARLGENLLRFIYRGSQAPTATDIESEAASFGLTKNEVGSWLANPEPQSLAAVESDSELADSAAVGSIPSLYVLNTANADGSPPQIGAVGSISGLEAMSSMMKQDYSPLRSFLP
jgi:hypothetical protein